MTTYVRRFENIFKPVVGMLEKFFSDVEKNYVLNGYYDKALQDNFLKDAKSFLKTTSAKNVISYQENQPIARCWNQLILHSSAPKILLLSDDIILEWMFRPCLELQIWRFPIFTINRTWSYFVVSKNSIKKYGWFEERFPANGQEDNDYALRMGIIDGKTKVKKLYDKNIYCFGIHNMIQKNEDPGWKLTSESMDNRYASVNVEFFNQKWEDSKEPLEGGINAYGFSYKRIKKGMETPKFYDYSLLDNPLKSPL